MGQTAVIAALIAAIVSLVGVILSSRLTESRDRRRVRWERELERFLQLEESAGQLVEIALAHGARDLAEVNEQLGNLYNSAGRFLRHDGFASSIRELHHALAWYLSREKAFATREEYESARGDIDSAFKKLLAESDSSLGISSRWLRRRGTSGSGANNSFKPKPLRGSA